MEERRGKEREKEKKGGKGLAKEKGIRDREREGGPKGMRMGSEWRI